MNPIVIYGNPTSSDLQFMDSASFSFPSSKSSSSTLSSTVSDAESAPELDLLFPSICEKCEKLVRLSNKSVPPEWNMPDLLRSVMGNANLKQIPGHLQDTYYDILLRGSTSWIFQDLCNFIDLINYDL